MFNVWECILVACTKRDDGATSGSSLAFAPIPDYFRVADLCQPHATSADGTIETSTTTAREF